jgi:argininosuccinate synthase
MTTNNILLAFSGGLDTSYCLALLKEQGAQVTTAIVDTGGMSPAELTEVEARSTELGADEHLVVDGRARLYDEFISYLLKANYLRNGVYPSCVGVERLLQAEEIARLAVTRGFGAVAHGSTGAGNDHVRFDAVIATLAPDVELITPIRDAEVTREASTAYLRSRGIEVPEKTTRYSINQGMMGTSIGGGETYGTWEYLPEDAWPATKALADTPDEPLDLTITFEQGLPVGYVSASSAVPAMAGGGFELLQALNELGAQHGIGRGIHTGTSIMGTGARLGFEAPGVTVLLAGHRELERVVLSGHQQSQKAALGTLFGDLLHEGHYYEPVLDDIRAFLDASQRRVTGEVRIRLHKGHAIPLGVNSDYSLLLASERLGTTYGHGSISWTGPEARAFSHVRGVAGRVDREAGGTDEH